MRLNVETFVFAVRNVSASCCWPKPAGRMCVYEEYNNLSGVTGLPQWPDALTDFELRLCNASVQGPTETWSGIIWAGLEEPEMGGRRRIRCGCLPDDLICCRARWQPAWGHPSLSDRGLILASSALILRTLLLPRFLPASHHLAPAAACLPLCQPWLAGG